MKVVFVGPSLPDARAFGGPDIDVRPPARQGDVKRAIDEGATSIGLIDGVFEFVAPIWHKEIIFALSRGRRVFGASSMGALRAAECELFGMVGVGRVFDDYKTGRRTDDGDVTLLHGPQELGYPPLSVPLVNVDATLVEARRRGELTNAEAGRLADAARRIFFKERSWKRIAEAAPMDWAHLRAVIEANWIDQKRLDAIELVTIITEETDAHGHSPDWTFNATPLWRTLFP